MLLSVPLRISATSDTVTILWDHELGPFSYNVYSTTNIAAPMHEWTCITNVTDLSVRLKMETGARFFTVTCVNTNTGEESWFATR